MKEREERENRVEDKGKSCRMDLSRAVRLDQYCIDYPRFSFAQSETCERSCSSSEMRKWERARNNEDSLERTLYRRTLYLDPIRVYLLKLGDSSEVQETGSGSLSSLSYLSLLPTRTT